MCIYTHSMYRYIQSDDNNKLVVNITAYNVDSDINNKKQNKP